MKKTIQLLCVSVFLLFSVPLSAQGFLDRVAKKASEKVEKKAEERAERKMDEKIDEGFDKAEEALESEKEEQGQSKASAEERNQRRLGTMMKKMGVSSEPVSIADQYTFSSRMKMRYQNMDSDGKMKDEGEVVTYISPGDKNFAYEFISGTQEKVRGRSSKGTFIMDYANQATIILSDEDGEKTGVVYGLKSFSDDSAADEDDYMDDYVDDYEEDVEYLNENVRKTGRTKRILGYKCEEYEFSSEEDEGNFWVTRDVKWKSRDTFGTIFRSAMYSHGIFNGFLMESESRDKETGEISRMQVTEIDEKTNMAFTPGDYELTNLGSIQFGEEMAEEEPFE
ncbi:MAG: DUF4412 domain-containing protein [Bacteroidota bacterium]